MITHSAKIHIAVVDDHLLFRQGLMALVNGYDDIKIILEASDGIDLIGRLRKAIIFPDVILLDVNMPNMNGPETMTVLQQSWPDIRVAVLSMYSDEFAVANMISKGARAYLSKGSPASEVHEAILSVYNTGYYHSRLVPPELFESSPELCPPELTDREKECLTYCCSELTNQQIATKMSISLSTYEKLKSSLSAKLQIKNRTGLVLFVIKTGIVPIYADYAHDR